MVNDTTLLLDLDGVSVERVERLQDGSRRVHLVTADESARACPTCGVFASRVKGSAVTRPRDLPYGESGLVFWWHKRRWYCREPQCPRRSFTEQIAQIPAGARLTSRLWCEAEVQPHAVGDHLDRVPVPLVRRRRTLHGRLPLHHDQPEDHPTPSANVTAPSARVPDLPLPIGRHGQPL